MTHTWRLAREELGIFEGLVDQSLLQTFNQDGSNGAPYANHLDGPHSELFLVIPVRLSGTTKSRLSPTNSGKPEVVRMDHQKKIGHAP